MSGVVLCDCGVTDSVTLCVITAKNKVVGMFTKKSTHMPVSSQRAKVKDPPGTFLWNAPSRSRGHRVRGQSAASVGGGMKGRILYLHSCGIRGQRWKMKGRVGFKGHLGKILLKLLIPPLSGDHKMSTVGWKNAKADGWKTLCIHIINLAYKMEK